MTALSQSPLTESPLTESPPPASPGTSRGRLATLDAYAAAALFASRLLRDSPDGVLLAQLCTPGVLEEWPLRSLQDRVGVAELTASAAAGESLQQIHADHQRLFVGPEQMLACPYESVYLNAEHLTFGSETLDVREWYHRYGVSAPEEGREPDDHIALELGFVSRVCLRAMDAAEGGDKALAEDHCRALALFLDEHLLLWGHDCLDHVAAHARTHFYQGVGLLVRGVLLGLERDFDR